MNGSATRAPSRGFVLLALLFVGVLGGGGWLAVLAPPGSAGQAERAVAVLERSRRAIQTLSAHATLYHDLYGATGAGPGHLPCPDRHQPVNGRSASRRLPLAGPDPPCASYPAPTGALPQHITVSRLRAGLDAAPAGAPVLGYRVDAAVINNPLNRSVNVRTMPAVLVRVLNPAGGRALTLRRATLATAVQRRVAAWLITQLLKQGSAPECEGLSPCPAEQALGAGAVPLPLLDGVPPSRHWFVRNDWSADIRLRFAPGCALDLSACRMRQQPGAPLHIDWMASSDARSPP